MGSRSKSRPPKKVETAAPVSAETRGRPTRWWRHAATLLALLLTNLAIYHRTANLGFLSVDDPDYVQNNPYIESFSAANLKFIFTRPYAANYAPANSYAVTPAGLGSAGSEAAAYYGQPAPVNYVPPRYTYRTTYAAVPVLRQSSRPWTASSAVK